MMKVCQFEMISLYISWGSKSHKKCDIVALVATLCMAGQTKLCYTWVLQGIADLYDCHCPLASKAKILNMFGFSEKQK